MNGFLLSNIVPLSTYDVLHPVGLTGNVFRADNIVIRDTEIEIYLSFPFFRPVIAAARTDNPAGFTVRELLLLTLQTYKRAYEIEEETAPVRTWEYTRECDQCTDDRALDVAPVVSIQQDCSICYLDMHSSPAVQLPCGHAFHRPCIQTWLDTSENPKCPLCRGPIVHCDICNDQRTVVEQYEGWILPPWLRESEFRPSTDGMYGICMFDLDDIMVTGFTYTRISRQLRVCAIAR